MEHRESLFRIPDYPAWFGADTFLLAGSAVHWIVLTTMAYQLSGSLAVAGWFATVRGVVSSIAQVVGGTFIDRHDHRTLILVQAGSCCVLWLFMGVMYLLGQLSFAIFAGCCICSSTVFGFLGGTTNAALIRVVGPERYPEAESVNQGRDSAVNTAGSPFGAVLFGISQAFPFFASAACDALAFVCALFLRLPADDVKRTEEEASQSFIADTVDGWRWALSSATIVSAVVIIGISQFGMFGTHQAVNLSLVERGVEPLFISLANVGTAIGIMVGSVISARICNRVPVGKGVPLVFLFMAASYIPMAIDNSYPFVVLSTCLASLPVPLLSALLNGFVFSKTPTTKQGRTRAAIMTVIMLIGSFSGGVAGELIPRIGFTGFVVTMMILALLGASVAAINPRLRSIPASPHWDEVDL